MAGPAMIGLAALGSGMKIVGGIKESKGNAEHARLQALENRRAAADTIREAREEERNFRVTAQEQLGSMGAELSARGVSVEGSGRDILSESKRNMDLDALSIIIQGGRRAAAYRRSGVAAEHVARAYTTAGVLSSIGTGLKGFGKVLKRDQ